ncbi:hypothetical protein CDAR_54331 [Caerostris darwini]|uniref:Uncharacterized protein n=1 Tax=Caerostris darwini TaxID=1538125 RepID=A0AAV4PJE3_9ARAC|nr:hypothetical protein CDAR_54331 [Caerostris darwini]
MGLTPDSWRRNHHPRSLAIPSRSPCIYSCLDRSQHPFGRWPNVCFLKRGRIPFVLMTGGTSVLIEKSIIDVQSRFRPWYTFLDVLVSFSPEKNQVCCLMDNRVNTDVLFYPWLLLLEASRW